MVTAVGHVPQFLGSKLRKAREQAGLTRQDVEQESIRRGRRVPAETIERWEMAPSPNPRSRDLALVCAIVGASVASVLAME